MTVTIFTGEKLITLKWAKTVPGKLPRKLKKKYKRMGIKNPFVDIKLKF